MSYDICLLFPTYFTQYVTTRLSRLLQLALLSPLSCLSVDINDFFIRPPINRHLDCFHGLAVVNNAAVSTEAHVSF